MPSQLISFIDRKCKNCGCIVDSHFESKHNCLNLHCECPSVDYVPPKKGQVIVEKDLKPHSGFCDCRECMAWLRKHWGTGLP